MASIAAPPPVRILLVGTSEGLARSLARCLRGDPRYVLNGVVPSLALARIMLPLLRPDLALLDWSEAGRPLPGILRMLRTECPGLRIACVASDEQPYRAAASQAGADYFLARERLYEELPQVVARIGQAP